MWEAHANAVLGPQARAGWERGAGMPPALCPPSSALSTAWLLCLQAQVQESWRAWRPGPEGPPGRCPNHLQCSHPSRASVLGPLRTLTVREGVLGGGGSPLRALLLLAWGRAGDSEHLLPTPAISPTSPGALFPSDRSRGLEDLHQASGPSVLVQKEAGRAGDGASGVTGGPWDLGRRPHPCGWPSKQWWGSSMRQGPL